MSTKKSIVVTGPTVEAAIKKGLAQLGVGPSQVIVEVLDEPVRGLFGIGARQARVRLQALVAAPPEMPPADPVVADAVDPVTEVVEPTEPEAPVEDMPSQDEEAVVATEPTDAENVEDAPPAQTSDVAEKAAPRPAATGTYEDDDFFDDEGNFYEDVEVLAREPSSAAPKEERTYVRRLSFVKPKPTDEEGASKDEATKVTETKPSPEPKPIAATREEAVTDDTAEPEPDVLELDEDDDEAQEIPTLNRGRRGPARFENFERRGRRYDDDEDDEADDDADVVVGQDESDDGFSVVHDDDETDTFVNVPDVPDTADDRTLAERNLSAMMDIMGLDMVVEVSQAKRDSDDEVQPWILNLRGDEAVGEALVGKNGETLSALQFLTRLMVSKQTGDRANIVVDVNEHRLRRTDKLADLANRMADEAVESGRKVKMEPMPSHERRIVHMVLRRRGDVKTDSVGKGDKRRVTIAPKSDETD